MLLHIFKIAKDSVIYWREQPLSLHLIDVTSILNLKLSLLSSVHRQITYSLPY